MRHREQSSVGTATVRIWARALPKNGTVLDLGCGSGVPISTVLSEEGLAVYGIDASESLIAAFRRHLPHAQVACEAIEDSRFFDVRWRDRDRRDVSIACESTTGPHFQGRRGIEPGRPVSVHLPGTDMCMGRRVDGQKITLPGSRGVQSRIVGCRALTG
ncbi:class I SAM-dependent methyltransferase [Microbulbifer litoralis]|uniref:class I SAM-dependent methyltransferase n=1 Tax=Microbulbifer litoralis TaxID=2933965 RepID=UPI003CE53573